MPISRLAKSVVFRVISGAFRTLPHIIGSAIIAMERGGVESLSVNSKYQIFELRGPKSCAMFELLKDRAPLPPILGNRPFEHYRGFKPISQLKIVLVGAS